MTRLYYEKILMDEFPDLQWVRVCTSAPFTITVYACDANLDLTPKMISKVTDFLLGYGMASCIHNVKHYFELQNDEAFPIGQIPDCVRNAALKGDVTRKGVQSAITSAFPFVDSSSFEIDRSTVTFHLLKDEQWTPYQVKFVELMLTEILPAGSIAKLSMNSLGI